MWATTLWSVSLAPLQWPVVIGAALVGAVCDMKTGKIPNLLTGLVLLSGLVWAVVESGLPGLADAATACLIASFPYVMLFVFAGGGAGDAKLMGAIGAWLGVINGSIVLFSVVITGVILAILLAVARKQIGSVLRNLRSIAWSVGPRIIVRKTPVEEATDSLPRVEDLQSMRYGVAIFVGVVVGAIGVTLCRA